MRSANRTRKACCRTCCSVGLLLEHPDLTLANITLGIQARNSVIERLSTCTQGTVVACCLIKRRTKLGCQVLALLVEFANTGV